jgi:chromosome partitioning protein
MKTFSILNCKGGVGKTTLTACIAQALSLTGLRVLVIDNDMQHNLSIMLTKSEERPTIKDLYRAPSLGFASQALFKAIKPTDLPNLHVIVSTADLTHTDVRDQFILKKTINYSRLDRFYNYILIDNPPGMDNLQLASIYASEGIIVPTELSHFALQGIVDMQNLLVKKFPGACPISKIVPNFYRNKERQRDYLVKLNQMFEGRVTETVIPYDPVFDLLVTERKILFLHYLTSRVTSYYVKLMHELFNLDEEKIWQVTLQQEKGRPTNKAVPCVL